MLVSWSVSINTVSREPGTCIQAFRLLEVVALMHGGRLWYGLNKSLRYCRALIHELWNITFLHRITLLPYNSPFPTTSSSC